MDGKTFTTLVIASRISDLARVQAHTVGNALKKQFPKIEIKYSFRESLGDKNLTDPLWKMPEKGVFTQDFLEDLKNGECDLVVHSWKDLPIENRLDTEIVGTLHREDMRDLLLVKKDSFANILNDKKIKIFSSSPRREYNLKPFLKKYLPFNLDSVDFLPVRGNVPTRLKKMLSSSDVDGLVVAKAAWDRLMESPLREHESLKKELMQYLDLTKWMILPLTENPTAAAQGALAIEIKKSRPELKKLLAVVCKPNDFKNVSEERETLKNYGGGCHQKIGINYWETKFGLLKIEKGEHQGQSFHNVFFKFLNPSPRVDKELAFPLEKSDVNFFERKKLTENIPDSPGYWIARENVLPEGVTFDSSSVIWTSGLKTWSSLAAKGIWVNGSSESLGEKEDPKVDNLVKDGFSWLKLTHDKSQSFAWGKNFSTYKLIPREINFDIQNKKFFYWMSGTGFKRACELDKKVLFGIHFCGPGNTWDEIKTELLKHNISSDPNICFSFSHWKNILGGNNEFVGTL